MVCRTERNTSSFGVVELSITTSRGTNMAGLILRSLLALVLLVTSASSVAAQEPEGESQRVLSVVHAALAAVSAEDFIGLTDLMLEDAIMFAIRPGGGGPLATTRSQARTESITADFVERGFDEKVKVAGRLATVWVPYDFYIDGEWSHCGIDLFTMIRSDGEWLIAALTYTVQQPPACEPHPDGPPGKASAATHPMFRED
jgi:hypothetical protein